MKRLKEYFSYKYDQFLSLGTFALVVGLFAGLLVILFIISIIMLLIYPEYNLFELLWMNFMHTIDPGTITGSEGSVLFLFIMTVVTFVGIFIFSLFISFILNGFQEKLETLRQGKSKVIEKNHTIILGYNDSIQVVLEELIEANENQRRAVVVVLSETDSTEMRNKISGSIENFKSTKVIYRTGSPYFVPDLDMCNVDKAKSIILLEDDLASIKALVALNMTEFGKDNKGHIVSLFRDRENMAVAENLVDGTGTFMCIEESIVKLMAQTCLQAGLSYIYSDLFDFDGDEIYFVSPKSLVGKTYLEAQKSYVKSTVIGLYKDGIPSINPASDTIICAEDQIIVITADDDTAVIDQTNYNIKSDVINKSKRKSSKKQVSIMFIGYNPKVLQVLKEFDNYVDAGSKVIILHNSTKAKEQLEALEPHLKNLTIEKIKGTTYKREVIEKAIKKVDKSIVIFYNENVSDENKDSQTLLSLLHLRDIEKRDQRQLGIITEIFDVNDTDIMEMANVDDFVISDLLANKMLTQVSENKDLKTIFETLLSDQGSELYLKPVEDYVDLGVPVDSYTLIEACSMKKETCIGYKIKNKQENCGVVLNPNKADEVAFNKGDCLIVLSED